MHYFNYVWKLKKKKKKSKLKCKLTHRYRDQRCSYQGWVKCVEGINCTVTDGKWVLECWSPCSVQRCQIIILYTSRLYLKSRWHCITTVCNSSFRKRIHSFHRLSLCPGLPITQQCSAQGQGRHMSHTMDEELLSKFDEVTEDQAFTAFFAGHPLMFNKLHSMHLNNAGLNQVFPLKSD